MAVTKIKPVKSTLSKALDYIENPDKTDGKMLISSFGCSYETADIEFGYTLSQALDKGSNLAFHLIQSFAPGEVDYEKAHEIGKQLADAVTKGQHEYVVTTHIDKGHMSRLGRNYLQVGMYTEMIFPQKGVRFIAINDGVDSAQGDNDFAPLRNIFNEWLVRDTSKKIKAVKRSKGMSGKPVTSKPVYGYLMDEDENFIIDEEAAPVVKQIYRLCLAGNGPTKIARMLTEQEIPTPGTLEYRRTGSTRRYHPGYECKWATNTVVHMPCGRMPTGWISAFVRLSSYPSTTLTRWPSLKSAAKPSWVKLSNSRQKGNRCIKQTRTAHASSKSTQP